jgi:hypothetical protein
MWYMGREEEEEEGGEGMEEKENARERVRERD